MSYPAPPGLTHPSLRYGPMNNMTYPRYGPPPGPPRMPPQYMHPVPPNVLYQSHPMPYFQPQNNMGPWSPPPPPPPSYPRVQADQDGWFQPPIGHHAPQTSIHPISHSNAIPEKEKIKEKLPETKVDDYWKNKLGPLPGATSNLDERAGIEELSFFSLARSQNISIQRPVKRKRHARIQNSGDVSAVVDGEGVSRSGFQMDRYADVFVPDYLRAIQARPHKFHLLSPDPIFPHPSYLNDAVMQGVHPNPQSEILASSPDFNDEKCPLLLPESYHKHFLPILQDELSNVVAEKSEIVLWKTSLSMVDTSDRSGPYQEGRKGYIADPDTQFIIHVPGIRENSPRLDIGDTVHLREIRMDIQAGTGLAFEGRVTTQRKREGIKYAVSRCKITSRHYGGRSL
ncbi:hypothetical protein C8J56DRAFT_497567 [Mycena floridula]|nr:hypothetical protein C8J56DRAFT_497567 [Mycena floridula]